MMMMMVMVVVVVVVCVCVLTAETPSLPVFSPNKGFESYIADATIQSPNSLWALDTAVSDARVPQV
jgi:hypothetical protein